VQAAVAVTTIVLAYDLGDLLAGHLEGQLQPIGVVVFQPTLLEEIDPMAVGVEVFLLLARHSPPRHDAVVDFLRIIERSHTLRLVEDRFLGQVELARYRADVDVQSLVVFRCGAINRVDAAFSRPQALVQQTQRRRRKY